MNKIFSIGLQSLLLVGALLPFSPLMPTQTIAEQLTAPNYTMSITTPEANLTAFGRGVPRFRSGGGTR